jgi:hypothetical protein
MAEEFEDSRQDFTHFSVDSTLALADFTHFFIDGADLVVLSCVGVPFIEIAALAEEAMDLVILDVKEVKNNFSEVSEFFF